MTNNDHPNSIPDLESVAARLRDGRATASPLEIDRIKLRAISQSRQPGSGSFTDQKGRIMKSRLTMIALIVVGLMMGTTGATVAITGTSGSGDAAQSQYKTESNNQDVLGGTGGGDLGNTADVPTEAQQVAATGGDDTLPFTGFAAIPLLILGLAALSGGLLLRRKAKDDPSG